MTVTRADLLVICAAVLLVGGLYARFWSSAQATTLEVRDAEGHVQLVDLSRDTEIHVHGPYGESVIQVQGGKARFISSPCRNKLCIGFGWLGHAGEAAACLPNGVLIHMLGDEPRYDAIIL